MFGNGRGGIESSYRLALQIDDVSGLGDGLLVRAKLMAAQDPEHYNPQGTDGQACSIWTTDYTMLWGGEGWLMEDVRALGVPEDCTGEMDSLGDKDPTGD